MHLFGGNILKDKISIIIPVYNSEKYLKRCLNSIKNQTYQNYEVILINDGSTDNSQKICKEYANHDNRYIVISKENSGVSDTRNIGINNATGKYITFIDSDDELEDYHIFNLINLLETNESEMAITSFYKVTGVKKVQIDQSDNKLTLTNKYKFIEMLLSRFAGAYYGSVWNKVYLSDVIKSNKIKFNTYVDFFEDYIFNIEYLRYIKSVSISHIPSYNYYIDISNSISKKYRNTKEMALIYTQIYHLHKKLISDNLTNKVEIFNFYACKSCLINLIKTKTYKSKKVIKEIIELFNISNNYLNLDIKNYNDKFLLFLIVKKNFFLISLILYGYDLLKRR